MKVFVSYSRKNYDTLMEILPQIERVLPDLEIWYDKGNLRGGDRWLTELWKQIEESDQCLLLISETWLESKYCREEATHAHRNKKRIIPVKITPTVQIPKTLKQFQIVDLSKGTQDSQGMTALYVALRPEAASEQPPAPNTKQTVTDSSGVIMVDGNMENNTINIQVTEEEKPRTRKKAEQLRPKRRQ